MCLQKISRPPPWKELEILKGSGLKGLGNSSGVRGLTKIHFQRARTTIISHQLLWVILALSLVMLQFSYHAISITKATVVAVFIMTSALGSTI